MSSGVTCNWCLRLHLEEIPTKTIERVCVSPASKDQICLLFTNKDIKRKLTSEQKKTKACLNLKGDCRKGDIQWRHF